MMIIMMLMMPIRRTVLPSTVVQAHPGSDSGRSRSGRSSKTSSNCDRMGAIRKINFCKIFTWNFLIIQQIVGKRGDAWLPWQHISHHNFFSQCAIKIYVVDVFLCFLKVSTSFFS